MEDILLWDDVPSFWEELAKDFTRDAASVNQPILSR
ncbi:hypothetical protein C8N36_12085 [Pelagimonas varians]|uniref:Uncharacterized protein n=1 Tax=Pelagimonas varians TaxID=696760 RepID=A0A238L2N3_9RHOB|nr:hypothetical protein C8N36_12085 [Pelagimonas varians]SMX49237.1 hypothetical protein PEV8663_04140 [Pelagimonas varians]